MKKYIVVIIIFMILMVLILFFFMNKYNSIHTINKSKEMLKYLYTLNEGEYIFKDGFILSSNGSVISEKYYFNGNGNINIDKYKNVRFKIDYNKKCISKTYVGNIEILNDKCGDFENINVETIKNNKTVSFTSNKSNLEYKISSNDDFTGEWTQQNYKDNIIINSYSSGDNYIWFKDEKGNISDVIKFNIECLEADNANYDKDVFYCSGSTLNIDGINWVVIEDTNNEITLMSTTDIPEKLPQCLQTESTFCYYIKDKNLSYKWSNSYINYYLNNVFIDSLSSNTKNLLVTKSICDEYENYNCNNESCGGLTKEYINKNNYSCNTYTNSKIKIISYDEYNNVYKKIADKSLISGNYYAINSYEKDKGTSIQYNDEFYILENLTNKLNVRPVISLSKTNK